MNFKKFISGVSAFAIAASAFAGMAVTANAENPTLTSDLEVAGYISKAYYNFTTNADGLLPTDGDLRYREGYGLFNFGKGARSADVTLPDGAGLAEDDIVVVDGRATQTYDYSVTISGTAADATLGTSTGYLVFKADSDMETLTFNVGRASTVRAIAVYSKDASVATADYTVKYVDENSSEIKASTTGNGVVGTQVPVDTAAYYAEGGQKYNYVSDNSAANLIAADGTTVVTVTYKAAAQYSYSVVDNQGDSIASGTGYEGDTVKVAYPKYINVGGTLYERGATNKEYNHSFTLDEDNKAMTLDYKATTIENVVFLAEGEDITGLDVTSSGNISIRASKAAAGVIKEEDGDVTVTSLPAGKYKVYGSIASPNNAMNLTVALGDNSKVVEATKTNNTDFSTDEWTITSDQVLTISSTYTRSVDGLDYIYVVKTGDITPDPSAEAGEATNVVTYSGDEYDGEATSAIVTVSYADMLADKVITLTYGEATKDVNGATNISGTGNITVGVVIQNIADANPVFTAGVR